MKPQPSPRRGVEREARERRRSAQVFAGNPGLQSQASRPTSGAQPVPGLGALRASARFRTFTMDVPSVGTSGTKWSGHLPFGMYVTGVRVSLGTACSTGTFTVDVNVGGTSILSTKVTVDATETTSTTAATGAVVSAPLVADDARVTVDVDDAGDGNADGCRVTLIGRSR